MAVNALDLKNDLAEKWFEDLSKDCEQLHNKAYMLAYGGVETSPQDIVSGLESILVNARYNAALAERTLEKFSRVKKWNEERVVNLTNTIEVIKGYTTEIHRNFRFARDLMKSSTLES